MMFLAVLLGFFLGAGTVVALAPHIMLRDWAWRALASSRRWTAEASRTIEARVDRDLTLPTREPDPVLGAPSRLNEDEAEIAASPASERPLPVSGPLAWPWTNKARSIFHREIPS